jgi:hypothetical protein
MHEVGVDACVDRRRRAGVAWGVIWTACLAGAAGVAGQDPDVRPVVERIAESPADTALAGAAAGCTDLPVHTAALAERRQLAGLGALPLRGATGLAPASAAPWSPEARLSDAVRACVEAGRVGPVGMAHHGGFWVAALPMGLELRHTTAYPRAMTDGSFRPGVGTMAGVVAGFAAGVGPVTVVVRPEFHHHQNADFDIAPQSIPGYSPYVHPAAGTLIDLPQRFGDEPFQVVSPGQTTIRVDAGSVVIGVSTENAWWGPGLRNPLLLSSAAPGMPHAFIGTARPMDIRIGKLFLRTHVARTTESDAFDTDPDNDHQLLSGTIVSFEPAPMPGLTLGVARFFAIQDGPDVNPGTLLRAAFANLRANPQGGDPLADNQHVSLFARWAFPDVGLAVYGELGRIDHWWEWLELITSPQAATAWMGGLQKVFAGETAAWRVMVESASLVDPMPSQLPGRSGHITWYTHTQLRQGHTHQGQLLGAPIGPGARTQALAVDRYAPRGDLGLELTRTVYNDDSYNQRWWRYFGTFGHDAELSVLARGRRALGPIDLHGALGYSHRWNRHFLGLAELVGTAWELDDLRRDGNWHLEVRGVWTGW